MDNLIYTAEQQTYIGKLAWFIEDNAIQMAVVDYLGMRDADGLITVATPDERRFGTRSYAHVEIYKLKIISKNKAWRNREAAKS